MKSYWIKTPSIIKKIFSNYVWDIPNDYKKVFLTFDDGPTPEITNWVLNELKKYNAKATFFCIGKNIKNNSEIFQNILNNGHSIGNHTNNHLNGWKTNYETYLDNVQKALINFLNNNSQIYNENSQLFRPPYGKITPIQSKKLRKLGYKIIMWNVLSADFDQNISPEECLKNVINNIKSGSIIVFHDSQKAFKNLEYALPKTLEYLYNNGFTCDIIN
jgi:peptidoglycan-N-acetylglucosamine deacetylase